MFKTVVPQFKSMSYGQLPRQRLDVFMPRRAVALPVVVFFYGGAWKRGSRHQYKLLAYALMRQGYVVVVPDYRLYPAVRFPAFVDDGAAATAWVYQNIAKFGGDPGRVYLMGHSAGAHIASMLALDPRFLGSHGRDAQTLAGVIGLAGPYDIMPFRDAELADTFGPEEEHERTQPINLVTRGQAVPFLLLHGSLDKVVGPGNSKRLWKKIEASGGRARMVFFNRLDHMTLLLALLLPGLKRFRSVRNEINQFIAGQQPAHPSGEFVSYDY
jgi:acetyl esterase/lipase